MVRFLVLAVALLCDVAGLWLVLAVFTVAPWPPLLVTLPAAVFAPFCFGYLID